MGEYCLPKSSTCSVYKARTGETQYLELGITNCDWTKDTNCLDSYLNSEYGGSNYSLVMNFTRVRPSSSEIGWINSVETRQVEFKYLFTQSN